jgi:hypothetical protein
MRRPKSFGSRSKSKKRTPLERLTWPSTNLRFDNFPRLTAGFGTFELGDHYHPLRPKKMPRSKSKQETPESAAENDDISMQEAPVSHQPSGGSVAGSEAEDASMADAEPVAESEAGGEEEDEVEEEEEEEDEPIKVKLVSPSTESQSSPWPKMNADISF